MSGVNLATGFPPVDATVIWRLPSEIPGVTAEFRAIVQTWRPSGPQRVYRLRTPEGLVVSAIVDLNPDTGRLRMVGCAEGIEPWTADLVVHP